MWVMWFDYYLKKEKNKSTKLELGREERTVWIQQWQKNVNYKMNCSVGKKPAAEEEPWEAQIVNY